MYPNRLGTAKFDRLEIVCYEIYDDDGCFSHHEYWIGRQQHSYHSLLDYLDDRHPSVSRLLFVLGENAFLGSVLEWNPADQYTRDAFYFYLASKVTNWEDQPY